MYFNIVVKDGYEYDIEHNELVFQFGHDFEKALEFFDFVVKNTEYHVEFLQFKEKECKGNKED